VRWTAYSGWGNRLSNSRLFAVVAVERRDGSLIEVRSSVGPWSRVKRKAVDLDDALAKAATD
jgi:hypothetical protein